MRSLALSLLLASGQEAPETAPRSPPSWDDFPVFVWRERHAGKPLPEELAAPFDGVILMREEDSVWARERGLAYLVWNVAGRDALHLDADEAWNARVEEWIRTHDEKLLVREPCLNDPKTVAQLFATLDATIAKHGEHPGLGFVLGDEVGLTPNGDPFDLCRCDFCEAAWREYAKQNDLPERAPLTDEVRLSLLEDDFSLLGAWMARRRFGAIQMSERLRDLAERVRAKVRRVPLGLLGIGDSSTFSGIDLTGGLAYLDFVECYPVGDARELALSLPERRTRVGRALTRPRAALATVFVAEETPAGAARRVWEHWMRGATSVVLWNDGELAARPEHAARLAETVERIREIQRSFPWLQPPWQGWTVLVHDVDSIALAWLKDALLDGATWPRRRSGFQEEHGTRERSVRGWLRQIEDAGFLPPAVPLSRLGELCFGGCGTLVLSHLLVLGPEDVAQLEHQLDFGATLVVDGPLGWVDRSGQPWKEDVLQRLRARAPDRVRTTLDRLGDSVRGWKKPAFSGEAAKVPWLISSRLVRSFVDVWPEEALVTALPNPRPGEAAPNAPLHLEVQAPPDHRLEWIHPPDGSELPAGDAAVFLLRRMEKPK